MMLDRMNELAQKAHDALAAATAGEELKAWHAKYLGKASELQKMSKAWATSATYHLDQEVDVAPEEIGQFTTFGEFSERQLRELFDEVESDLGSFPFVERLAKRYYLEGIRNRLLGEKKGEPNPKCVALNTHMRLLPNGQVPSCQFNTSNVGSLRGQSFEELWFGGGEEISRQRKWVHDCPGCWAESEVLPNAVYTGDLAMDDSMTTYSEFGHAF